MTHPNAPKPVPSKAARRQTIFRGAPGQREYTTLLNSVIDDGRLELDELAALIKLLKLPKNWQAHPGQIRNEVWKVGREKYYRIMQKLADCGYVLIGEMIRNGRGQWDAREFLVYAEPQAVTEKVSISDEGNDGDPPTPPPAPRRSETVASVPHTAFPHAADPHSDSPADRQKKDITNSPLTPPRAQPPPEARISSGPDQSAVPLPKAVPPVSGTGSGPPMADRGSAEPAFDDLVRRFAPDPAESLERAGRAWLRLSSDDRRDASEWLERVLAARAARGQRRPSLRTYLRDKLWSGLKAAGGDRDRPPERFFLTRQMAAQCARWRDHLRRTRGPFSARWFDAQLRWRGVTMPSEWPPGGEQPLEPVEEARAAVQLIARRTDSEERSVAALLAADDPDFSSWVRLARLFGVRVAVNWETDFTKAVGDPARQVYGAYFPARRPPQLSDDDLASLRAAVNSNDGGDDGATA